MQEIYEKLNEEFIRAENEIAVECREFVERNSLIAPLMVKEVWPTEATGQFVQRTSIPEWTDSEGVGYTEVTYSLKHAAINSPEICLEDIRQERHIEDIKERVKRILSDNLKWIWEQKFQTELINHTRNHSIDYKFYGSGLRSYKPRKLNFFGKPVSPFVTTNSKLWIVNPKYKRAAEQVIHFDPDTVHFQFPEGQEWTGKVTYHNIPDAQRNAHGAIGFFRVIMKYAARPVRPDLGSVVTVCPNRLWYWAWKIMGYVP